MMSPASLQVKKWLPDMDLNHDKQIQSLLCYRYTIGQTTDVKGKTCSVGVKAVNNSARFLAE